MVDPSGVPVLLDGTIESVGKVIAATAALGTASSGLVDASKAFGGGISNVGFGFVKTALAPFETALRMIDKDDPYASIRANWLNGVDKAEQKSVARGLVRLGLTSSTAAGLAAQLSNIDPAKLTAAVQKIETGSALSEDETNVLGRFDAIVDARLDAAFERADQLYRNTTKVASAVVSVLLAIAAAAIVSGSPFAAPKDWLVAVLIGLVAVPLAPVAKDLTSAISTAVSAFKTAKR